MSMACPSCGAAADCIDSRGRVDGTTRRRYRCRRKFGPSSNRKKCPKWTTIETVVPTGDGGDVAPGGRAKARQAASRNALVDFIAANAGPMPFRVSIPSLRLTLKGDLKA